MSENQRSPMEDAAIALYYHVAQRIKEGKSRQDIMSELTQLGIQPQTAEAMLNKLDESRANVARRNGYRNALMGAVISGLALLPIFGIGIAAAQGPALALAVFILGGGLIVLIRGLMQITGL